MDNNKQSLELFKVGDKVKDWAGDIGSITDISDCKGYLDVLYDSPDIADGKIVTHMNIIDDGSCECNFTVIKKEEDEYEEYYLNQSMIKKKSRNEIIFSVFTNEELLEELKRRMK